MDLLNLDGVEVLQFSYNQNLPEPIKQLQLEEESDRRIYHCNTCNIDLNSKTVFEQHKNGLRHIKRDSMIKLKQNQIAPLMSKQVFATVPMQDFTIKGYRCDVCNLALISKLTYEQHITGQKHLKKVKMNSLSNDSTVSFRCDVCDMEMPNKQQLEIHLNGKKHLKKLKIIKKINDVADSISNHSNNKNSTINQLNTKIDDKTFEEFKCDICNLSLISKDQLTIHLAGKKHLKRAQANCSDKSDPNTKKTEKEDQFENLNIAWNKYTVKAELKQQLKGKYDFYCELCKKFMQKKLQLVDHLKSKKHHRRIYEKRNSSTTNDKLAGGKRISFVKKKPTIVAQSKVLSSIKRPIKFISKNNPINNTPIKTFKMFNSNVNNMDLNAAFEQPQSDNIYSSVKPGQVQYYQQPISDPYMQHKNDTSLAYDTTNYYEQKSKFLKNNESIPIAQCNDYYPTPNYNYTNTNFINNNYENITPTMQTNCYGNVNQNSSDNVTIRPTDEFNQSKTEYQTYQYDMFSNLAMLQYTTAFAAAKQNIK